MLLYFLVIVKQKIIFMFQCFVVRVKEIVFILLMMLLLMLIIVLKLFENFVVVWSELEREEINDDLVWRKGYR